MSQDAINLTKALKGEVKTQGNWGEMILERILEESGLRKGIEFDREESFSSENGKRLRCRCTLVRPQMDSYKNLSRYRQK